VAHKTDSVTVNAGLVRTHLKATTRQEAIASLASLLLKQHLVDDGFCEAVLAREEVYPTGLPLPDIPVAIPHTEAGHCKSPAMAVGILDQPVEFGEMGADPGSMLKVRIVFVLALNDPKKQVEWLQRLVAMFQEPGLLAELAGLSKPRLVSDFLCSHL
jgi:PTS system galactitol-specific IIA component